MISRFTSLALIAILASCSSSSSDPAPGAKDTGTSPPGDTGTSPPGDTGGGTADTAPAGNTVTVGGTGFVFSPATLKVKVGDTVTWQWAAGGHSVTSGDSAACTADAVFDSKVQASGFTFTQKFTKAGTVNYFCAPHCAAGMKGSIVVE